NVVPLRAENGQVQLALIPGTHSVELRWQSEDADGVIVRSPPIDLQVASSNVTTTLQVGERWVLLAGGRGVGPAILYWGELAVFALVLAIPYGLLASPDMRIAGAGQSYGSLSWFTDQSENRLPGAWVLSVSLWWYKTAMLAWALWLAFALTRWLPVAWRALHAG